LSTQNNQSGITSTTEIPPDITMEYDVDSEDNYPVDDNMDDVLLKSSTETALSTTSSATYTTAFVPSSSSEDDDNDNFTKSSSTIASSTSFPTLKLRPSRSSLEMEWVSLFTTELPGTTSQPPASSTHKHEDDKDDEKIFG
jgi:hypothetical protein